MGFESQRNRIGMTLIGVFAHLAENELVAAMNPIEVTDGQDGALQSTARTLEAAEDAHRSKLERQP
jgi:hypothetical protein